MSVFKFIVISALFANASHLYAHESDSPASIPKESNAAAKPVSCLTKILEYLKSPELSSAQVKCVQSSQEFKTAMGVLCIKDKEGKELFSKNFALYLDLEKKVAELEAKIKEAQEATNRGLEAELKTELMELNERWEATVKPNIDAALSLLTNAIFRCTKNP